MKKRISVRSTVACGLFAALIFLATYLFHIPTAHGGYVHVGDTVIYLAASLMPTPLAALCGAVGGGLSDALSPGGIVWVIPTLIIKPVMTLFFTSKSGKIICRRNIAAVFTAGIVGVACYDLVSAVMFGNFLAPLIQLPVDLIQPAASGALYLAVGAALDKSNIKKRFAALFENSRA